MDLSIIFVLIVYMHYILVDCYFKGNIFEQVHTNYTKMTNILSIIFIVVFSIQFIYR